MPVGAASRRERLRGQENQELAAGRRFHYFRAGSASRAGRSGPGSAFEPSRSSADKPKWSEAHTPCASGRSKRIVALTGAKASRSKKTWSMRLGAKYFRFKVLLEIAPASGCR